MSAKGGAVKLYLNGILDESRSSEEDAVSPGRHTSLFTAVVAQGVSSVLVKLVGGAEGDGRLPNIAEGMPCKHLPPTLILHCAILWSLCNTVVVVQYCGHCAILRSLCNTVVVVQYCSHCSLLWSLCNTVVIMQALTECSIWLFICVSLCTKT